MPFLYPYDVPGGSSNFCSISVEHIFWEDTIKSTILWNNLAYSTNQGTKLESWLTFPCDQLYCPITSIIKPQKSNILHP